MLSWRGEGSMRTRMISLLAAVLIAAAGCSRGTAPKVESKAQTRATNPDGSKAATTTESKQFGSTLVSKTERTDDTGKGSQKLVEETVVGTVTDFTAGKKIVVMTGDGSKHDYDLADKKTTASVDRRVTVGTK